MAKLRNQFDTGLLADEMDPNPEYVQNSWPEEQPQFGPPPPTFYATNVPDTAQKWGSQGQDYTFLAESPGAMKTAEELGAPRVMKGYQEPEPRAAVGPEPKPGELDELGQFKDFWGHVVNEKWAGEDPTEINPEEIGFRKREELQKKYYHELFMNDSGSQEYKKYEKLIEQGAKDAEKIAERKRLGALEEKKIAHGFFKEKMTAERKAADASQPKPQTRANVEEAQKYTEAALYGPNAWQNYDLTEEDLDKIAADKNYMPKNRKVKARILTDVNRVRTLAGLPPIDEEDFDIPIREYTQLSPGWTGEPWRTEGKMTKETKKGYRYAEGQKAAPEKQGAPQVVRTGTDRKTGRKVVMYSDGRTVYAPN